MILPTMAIIAAMAALAIVFYVVLIRLFASRSGLGQLSRLYGAARAPEGPVREKQTLMIGAVQWKRCVTVGAGESGLYLRVDANLFSLPAVLIPWRALQPVGKILLYGRPAILLAVGRPEVTTVTLLKPLFDTLQPWLQVPETKA